jgi:hypothetical protein
MNGPHFYLGSFTQTVSRLGRHATVPDCFFNISVLYLMAVATGAVPHSTDISILKTCKRSWLLPEGLLLAIGRRMMTPVTATFRCVGKGRYSYFPWCSVAFYVLVVFSLVLRFRLVMICGLATRFFSLFLFLLTRDSGIRGSCEGSGDGYLVPMQYDTMVMPMLFSDVRSGNPKNYLVGDGMSR